MITFHEQRHHEVTGFYSVEYSIPQDRMVDFLKKVGDAGLGESVCWVTEDVDRDMKNVSGTYSLDRLISCFDSLVRDASPFGDLQLSIHTVDREGHDFVIFLYPKEAKGNLYTQAKDRYVPLEKVVDVEIG